MLIVPVSDALADRDRGIAACEEQDWATAARELAPEEPTTTDVEVVRCLAFMHFAGDALSRDAHASLMLWKRVADLGNDEAEETVGFFYLDSVGTERDLKLAEVYFLRAAAKGNMNAMADLSLYYWLGFIGGGPDYEKSVHWTTKLAEIGHLPSQLDLMRIYSRGDHVAEDDKQAVTWALKAAKQDSIAAYMFLGDALAEGRGIARDPVEAYKWFNLAALHRESAVAVEATRRREEVAKDLTAEQVKQAQRLAFDWRLTAKPQ
jgi:TPR repeat protein